MNKILKKKIKKRHRVGQGDIEDCPYPMGSCRFNGLLRWGTEGKCLLGYRL